MAEVAASGPRELPEAVLFDLDDTILATSDGADEAWVAVTDRFAPVLCGMGHDVAPDALRTAIQDYRVWFWSDAERNRVGRLDPAGALRQNVRGGLDLLGIDPPGGLTDEMADAWTDVRWSAARAFPGALETLRVLRSSGVRLGLVTNGSAEVQRAKVDHLGLADLVDHVQIEGAVGFGKPDPRAYSHALRSLGASPESAWMAGDNLELDVLAPMRMGVLGIWVDWAGEGLPAGSGARPDRVVRAIAELVDPAVTPA